MSTKLTVSALSRAMGRIAPLRLAESWDNVGLLLESPVVKPDARRILLTIDLTESVVQEALSSPIPTAAIVCYHPALFRPLKSFTLSNSLQSSILTCAAQGISLYSPHTALDSVKGGVNDWLADVVQSPNGPKAQVQVLSEIKDAEEGTGIGRKVTFDAPVTLEEVVQRVKKGLGLSYVQLARSSKQSSGHVQSIALCAGSGGSVIGDTAADLYFTGEMSHHEVLAAVARGSHVLLCGHSNTERGYLPILKKKLEDALGEDGVQGYDVLVSTADRDPLEIL